MSVLPQGSTIGIIGGGQLGRMLAMAAARLGYRTTILEPQPDCPAAQVANRQIVAAYDDASALEELARTSAVVTYEFENVPVAAAEALAKSVAVYPPPKALEVSQDRLVEKRFLNDIGVPTAKFGDVDDDDRLALVLGRLGGSGVLKTRRMGYDGKGQRVLRDPPPDRLHGVCAEMGGVPLILEEFVPFEREISVIAARGIDGSVVAYEPAENVHRNGILHSSTVPAAISSDTAMLAREHAVALLRRLSYVGVLGLEFFVTGDGGLVANEFAPRVHNSGHWTIDGATVSQFEQHIRAVAGWPLAKPLRLGSRVEMTNMIGQEINEAARWMTVPGASVHVYGKGEARAGRKMGHVTRVWPAK
jgi:5-(carboxyamino)imidazole ribonucleotide synthase